MTPTEPGGPQRRNPNGGVDRGDKTKDVDSAGAKKTAVEANIGSAAKKSSGEPVVDNGATGFDAPSSALNRVRAAARGRGDTVGGHRRRASKKRNRMSGGEAATGRDPKSLDAVVSRLVAGRGWKEPIAVGSVLGKWQELVGPEISAHCVPESFEGTVVRVRTDSTAWSTQLRLLVPQILAKIDAELGQGIVTEIRVVGPQAPSWRKGYWHVKGRGPRDTYG